MPAEISLVILNYQGEPWLGRCLESICAQTAATRLEVVVVDNLSTDKSREICESFRTQLPHFQFIANKENLWYCEGNNVGARAASSPLLFFLNNDVWLEPDCVERLLAAATDDTTPEIFAARVLDYASDHYQGFGALGFDWLGCMVGVPDHDRPRELFSAYGCAFVIRKKCFERVGGFPAEVQAYTDEIDLAWRVCQRTVGQSASSRGGGGQLCGRRAIGGISHQRIKTFSGCPQRHRFLAQKRAAYPEVDGVVPSFIDCLRSRGLAGAGATVQFCPAFIFCRDRGGVPHGIVHTQMAGAQQSD